MGAPEVTKFLTSLAVDEHVAASTQNQALSALLFLYKDVLEVDLPWLDGVVRAKRPARLPVVLTRDEVRAVLQRLDGAPRLMACLLYGAGLRVLECCRLRVQDVDFATNQIVVRGGKGDKDRVTMLPTMAKLGLVRHLEDVRAQHEADVAMGAGWVELPTALLRKVSERRSRVGLAMAIPRHAPLPRSPHGPAPAPPPARVGPPARREGRGPEGGHRQARQPSYPPALVRDPSAGRRP
jgi:site-specific recombinase XerD